MSEPNGNTWIESEPTGNTWIKSEPNGNLNLIKVSVQCLNLAKTTVVSELKLNEDNQESKMHNTNQVVSKQI